MKSSIIFFFIYISLFISSINCLLQEKNNTINITITNDFWPDEIGKIGALIFLTDFEVKKDIFDQLDIEENTKFNATIFNQINKNNNISCRLTMYEAFGKDFFVFVFCYLDENIPKGNYAIFFKSRTFNYKGYEINLKSTYNNTFKKLDIYSLQLYPSFQYIMIEDSKDSYELKFIIISYDNQKIFLTNENIFFNFDNCIVERNELKCQILKVELERVMNEEIELFAPFGMSQENIFYQRLNIICIDYINLEKMDIFVGITKLLQGNAEGDESWIVYETNITGNFNIGLTHDFSLKFVGEMLYCSFIKYENTPLLMLCKGEKNVQYLGKIEEPIELNDLNIKYNFIIQPVTNNETIYANTFIDDNIIVYLNPEILDFTSVDSLQIIYLAYNPEYMTGLRLNPEGEDLKCKNSKYTKQCFVPKSHFKGKKSGLFFTSHINYLNSRFINYEAPPVKVILPNSNNDKNNNNNKSNKTLIIVVCLIVGIILLALVIFLFIRIKRKRISSNEIDIEEGIIGGPDEH